MAQRWYKIVLDDAVIDIDYYNSKMTINNGTKIIEEIIENFDRNSLFIAQQNDFFERIAINEHISFSQQQVTNAYNIIKICNT